MDSCLAEVLRLAVISLDESAWAGCVRAQRKRANILERAGDGLRRVMEAEEIAFAADSVGKPDAGDDKADFADLVSRVGDGNGARRLGAEEFHIDDFSLLTHVCPSMFSAQLWSLLKRDAHVRCVFDLERNTIAGVNLYVFELPGGNVLHAAGMMSLD